MKRLLLWRSTRRQLPWAIGIGCSLVALAAFIFFGYRFSWDWTGFPAKRLFDWIQILVIPVAVAIGTFALNRAAKKRDDTAQARAAEESSLQSYLEYISRMLTDPDRPLRRSLMGDNLSVVARAHTLTVLGRFEDGERKRSVLQFLYEAGLINRNYTVINLQGANLQRAYLPLTNLAYANLRRADLQGADLRRANLQGANLQGFLLYADLQGANLQEVNLRGINLQGANLQRAYLRRVILQGADLRRADLQGADLQGANLQGADLRRANLQGANLQGADLRRADLQGANLQGAEGLTQDLLNPAFGDDTTTLPEWIDNPKSWSARNDEHPSEQ